MSINRLKRYPLIIRSSLVSSLRDSISDQESYWMMEHSEITSRQARKKSKICWDRHSWHTGRLWMIGWRPGLSKQMLLSQKRKRNLTVILTIQVKSSVNYHSWRIWCSNSILMIIRSLWRMAAELVPLDPQTMKKERFRWWRTSFWSHNSQLL